MHSDNGFVAGGTFHGLARTQKRLTEPAFEHKPRYPRVSFVDKHSLDEALRFAVEVLGRVADDLGTPPSKA